MKAGELYRYAPDANKWCRHGLRFIAERGGHLWALDTYWGVADWLHCDALPAEQIAIDLEFLLDLSNAEIVTRDRYERYAEKDRAYVPMGSVDATCWVSKSAKPDPQKCREWLRLKLGGAEATLRGAEHRVERAKRELDEFEKAQATPASGGGLA
jgi:hypothetical protein